MTVLLVFAKAPVAGLVKTRMVPEVGARRAARIAAAALLDTLDAVLSIPDVVPVVAMAGDPAHAERAAELVAAMSACTVIPQRGKNFADRLANAHADIVHLGQPVLQIGGDTPQVSPELLAGAIDRLHEPGVDAVLGPATDGGWWSLGLHVPLYATVIRTVPMSRSDTGARTWSALRGAGLTVRRLIEMSDVDTMADARLVAGLAPHGRFAGEISGSRTRAGEG